MRPGTLAAKGSSTAWIWRASSLVGDTTTAPTWRSKHAMFQHPLPARACNPILALQPCPCCSSMRRDAAIYSGVGILREGAGERDACQHLVRPQGLLPAAQLLN